MSFHFHFRIINPIKADEKVIKTFHSQEYVEYLKFCTEEQDEEKIFNSSRDDFGLGLKNYNIDMMHNLIRINRRFINKVTTAILLKMFTSFVQLFQVKCISFTVSIMDFI